MEQVKLDVISVIEESGIFLPYEYENDIDLREYDIDSITLISIIVSIERRFSIDIPDEYLLPDTFTSLNGLINLVDSQIKNTASTE